MLSGSCSDCDDGVTTTDVAGASDTVTVVDPLTPFDAVAVMVAVPLLTPVYLALSGVPPTPATVATAGLEDDHVTA
jgi:hypothetical protein